MRKGFFIFVSLLISTLLMFVSISYAVDGSNEKSVTVYDPVNMTMEERWEWVQENVEPVFVGKGQYTDRSGTLHSGLDTSYVGPNDMYNIAKLETKVWFTVSDSFDRVESWGTDVFNAVPLLNSLSVTSTDYDSTRISNDNVRMVYEAWYANLTGAYYIEHWYKVYGYGVYALYVNKGGPL
ncbi:MAG: hypothetical protein IJK25_01695 [Firmicutes bacterium]|nr:hypothetical protein [Bacillota bacterium]